MFLFTKTTVILVCTSFLALGHGFSVTELEKSERKSAKELLFFNDLIRRSSLNTKELERTENGRMAISFFKDWKPDFDFNLWLVAQSIALNEVPSDKDINSIKLEINSRVKQGMTLLFFAVVCSTNNEYNSTEYRANLLAIDKLLKAGADPTLPDRIPSARAVESGAGGLSFVYYAAGSGKIATDYLRLYLKNNGNPNAEIERDGTTLLSNVTTVDNFESYKLLLEYGADLFKGTHTDEFDIPLVAAAFSHRHYFIDYAIEKKLLQNKGTKYIPFILRALANGYWLRDDDTSRDIFRITKKILQSTGYKGDKNSDKILIFGEQHAW